jgi:hypothetical protein
MVSALTLLTLSLSASALARGGGGGGDSSPPFRNETSSSSLSQCHQLSRLTRLVDIASNTTLLAAKTDGDPTKATEIQAKASTAAEKITTLQADATLMAECVKVFAEDEMRDACREMKKLQKLQEAVADSEKRGEKAKGNETKVERLKAQAAEGLQRLAELQGNATFVEFCKESELKGDCGQLERLRGWLAGNGTGEGREGGGGEAEKWEERMEKAKKKLEELEGAEALKKACEAQGEFCFLEEKGWVRRRVG